MFNSQIFAERLKKARVQKHLSQAQLAKAVGVSAATISSYETPNGAKIPALDKAAALADELEVGLDWLCGKDSVKKVMITDFDVETYLRALVVVITEMTNSFEEYPQTHRGNILITNGAAVRFVKQCLDVLKVYRNGTLTCDLYETCVEKIISNYSDYTIAYDNFLTNDTAAKIDNDMLNLIEGCLSDGSGVSPGRWQTSIFEEYTGEEITLDAFISEKTLKSFLPKGE